MDIFVWCLGFDVCVVAIDIIHGRERVVFRYQFNLVVRLPVIQRVVICCFSLGVFACSIL